MDPPSGTNHTIIGTYMDINTIRFVEISQGKTLVTISQLICGMGDAICYSRVLECYRRAFPIANITFHSYYPELFGADPHVDDVKKMTWSGCFPSKEERSAGLWVEDYNNKNLTLELCRAAGFKLNNGRLAPIYYLTPAERRAAEALLRQHGCRIVVHPRGWNNGNMQAWFSGIKNWPTRNWASLVRALDEPVIAIGSKSDLQIEGTVDLRGQVPLRISAAIACMARVFVTCDSGFYWLTASSPVRRVVLLGERRKPELFVRSGDVVRLGQYRCGETSCNSYWECPITGSNDTAPCLDSITVESVFDAVKDCLL